MKSGAVTCVYTYSPREVASTGPTDKLSDGMDRHRLAHPRPHGDAAPMTPLGGGGTPDPCIGWRYFPGYYPAALQGTAPSVTEKLYMYARAADKKRQLNNTDGKMPACEQDDVHRIVHVSAVTWNNWSPLHHTKIEGAAYKRGEFGFHLPKLYVKHMQHTPHTINDGSKPRNAWKKSPLFNPGIFAERQSFSRPRRDETLTGCTGVGITC